MPEFRGGGEQGLNAACWKTELDGHWHVLDMSWIWLVHGTGQFSKIKWNNNLKHFCPSSVFAITFCRHSDKVTQFLYILENKLWRFCLVCNIIIIQPFTWRSLISFLSVLTAESYLLGDHIVQNGEALKHFETRL